MLLTACSARVERIQLAPGSRTLEYAVTHLPFFVWGLNYDHDSQGRLLEDYWVDEWSTVESDFKEMKALGANVVRVHLQLGAFLNGPAVPNVENLARLAQLVTLAENNGLYLDLTGLGAYRGSADPEWYLALDETARWDAQAFFWQQVAGRLANRGGVMLFDLINEPITPVAATTDWTPGEVDGFSRVQQLVLDPSGRAPSDIAAAWRRKMRDAIRSRDATVLISVGQLPIATQPGFTPNESIEQLDLLAVHVYPDSNDLAASAEVIDAFVSAARPVLVEETFAVNCTGDEWEQFVNDTRSQTAGYVGFYRGEPGEEGTVMKDWLERFERLSQGGR